MSEWSVLIQSKINHIENEIDGIKERILELDKSQFVNYSNLKSIADDLQRITNELSQNSSDLSDKIRNIENRNNTIDHARNRRSKMTYFVIKNWKIFGTLIACVFIAYEVGKKLLYMTPPHY